MNLDKIILLIFLSCWLISCAPGSGEGLAENGRPLSEVGNNVALAATLESVQANIFDLSCAVSGCHSGSSSPLGLDLSDGISYSKLVNISSLQQPDKFRINPGNAQASYLLQKLRGDSGISGERMPRGGARLNQELIDTLALWINNGAPASTGSSVATAPVITATSIPTSGNLRVLPATITVNFSQPMDPLTLVNMTLILEAAGLDASFNDGNETRLVIQPTLSGDGLRLSLDLSSNASVGDNTIFEQYRLTIKGSGVSVARALNAQVIDGDNDGNAGADYVLEFAVVDSLLPDFTSLETKFFVPNCAKSGCHEGIVPAAGMNLELGNVFVNTVDVASSFMPSTSRIVSGNAGASAIIQALEGTTTAIPQMPFDNPGSIPQSDIDILREWINNGANP